MTELPLSWTIVGTAFYLIDKYAPLFIWFGFVIAVVFGIYIGNLLWNRYLCFDKYHKPFYTMDDVDD